MNSSVSHAIKHRKEAKDVFYTPESVAKTHIASIQEIPGELWYDPFAGKKVYYNNFPSRIRNWAEITDGVDFFDFEIKPDIICSNPPYSIIDKVLAHSVALKPRIISYLLLEGKMTPKRMEYMNANGYSLTGIYQCKVYSWYGMAVAYTFTKMDTPTNEVKYIYDRIVHR
jgi:hypothetical protein